MTKKLEKKIKIMFYVLVGVFVWIMMQMFIPFFNEILSGTVFLIPFILFSILGIVFLVMVFKLKIKGWLRKFLILTALSAAGFFVFIFLHNFFYAMAVLSQDIIVLKYAMEFLQIVFFLVATLGCPIGFLIGVTGSIIMFMKRKK